MGSDNENGEQSSAQVSTIDRPAPSAIHHVPDEILLEIVSLLRTTDLVVLALVSKRLSAIAQDALYRSVNLSRPRADHWDNRHFDEESEHDSHFRMLRFLRTVIDRPDLAKRTSFLRLSIARISEPGMALTERKGNPFVNWELEPIYAAAIKTWDRLGYQNEETRKELVNRKAGPYIGVLLALLPSLTRLDFSGKDDEEFNLLWFLYGPADFVPFCVPQSQAFVNRSLSSETRFCAISTTSGALYTAAHIYVGSRRHDVVHLDSANSWPEVTRHRDPSVLVSFRRWFDRKISRVVINPGASLGVLQPR
jgi:hypothetical protein